MASVIDKVKTKIGGIKDGTSGKIPTPEDMVTALDAIYEKVLDGVPFVSPPVETMSHNYLDKSRTVEQAAKDMFKNQVIKCATSGVLTGFGGFITLPVTIPANVGSVLYVQMRMIGCAAYMGGYDLRSDQVQTFVYACLAGVSMNEVVKKFGVRLGQKVTTNTIKKIPGKALQKINKLIGFRFITKFGETGLINLGKMVPVVGAAINGGLDYTETKLIANRAYKMFIENNFDVGDNVITIEPEDLDE